MSNYFFPNQNRFSDPYQQRITNYGTQFKQKYLSRISNLNLRSISDNIVLKGLDIHDISFINSMIYVTLKTGIVICDNTLIEITTSSTLSIDVSTLGDTTTDNCHLALITDFQYIETPDVNSQTALALHLYHISSDGTVINPSGFNSTRSKLLLCSLDFTKSGSNVTAVRKYINPLTILGTTYYIKGFNSDNINFYDVFDKIVESAFDDFISGSTLDEWKKELIFMDMSRL